MPLQFVAEPPPVPNAWRIRETASAERRLIWMCHLSREQPAMKPLAFEALLQARVLVWSGAPASATGRQGEAQSNAESDLSFRTTRYPQGGVADHAAAIFTDLAHFDAHVRGQGVDARHCYVPQATCDVIRALAEQALPLEIDPGSRHHLYLTSTQVRDWISSWDAQPPRQAAASVGRQFVLWEPHPKLVDRLGAFLAQFDTIGRAWVCQVGDAHVNGPADGATDTASSKHAGMACAAALGPSEPGTLLLDAMTAEDEERIRRALPLISDEIRLPYRPLRWVATLPRRYEDMPRERQELLKLVYDRSMSARPLSRRVA